MQGQGSGFFIDPAGYIVTNNHVVDGRRRSSGDDRTTAARSTPRSIGPDPKTDLALLKVRRRQLAAFVKLADADSPRVGDWVVAIGNPFGLGGTVTAGIVSARGRDIGAGPYDDFLQIDAPINPGNSGGPIFNLKGEVIGINTAIYSPTGGSVGIGFAIPAEPAKTVDRAAAARTAGSQRGWLGVQIQRSRRRSSPRLRPRRRRRARSSPTS